MTLSLITTPATQIPEKEHQQELLMRARQGEPEARDELLLSLQPLLFGLAGRSLRQGYPWQEDLVEPMDLVNSANVALLKWFAHALVHPEPIGYLLKVARTAMIDCLSGKNDLIKTHAYQERPTILSLDTYVDEDGRTLTDLLCEGTPPSSQLSDRATQEYARLLQAIEQLPPKQRHIIERCYGLNGHAPESLNAIGRSRKRWARSTKPSITNAYYHKKLALITLRHLLVIQSPGDTEQAIVEERSEGS